MEEHYPSGPKPVLAGLAVPSWLQTSSWTSPGKQLASQVVVSFSLPGADHSSPVRSKSNGENVRPSHSSPDSSKSAMSNPPVDTSFSPPSSQHQQATLSSSNPPPATLPPTSVSSASTPLSANNNNQELERKTARLFKELGKSKIELEEVQLLASQGIPNEASLRAISWKLLLGYLPLRRDLWEGELAKKRKEYERFCQELIVNPSDEENKSTQQKNIVLAEPLEDGADLIEVARMDVSEEDHPLSIKPTSVWNQYFQDTEIVDQINRDVQRTHPDIPFFCNANGSPTKAQESMKRILFLWAKLNPGIRYVQGMNEVLAPLLFVFRTDPDQEMAMHAEADAFFCFIELFGHFRDNFCQQLDNSTVGIKSAMSRLMRMLRYYDEELWRQLETVTKVNPQFYAFRWITLLLTQEFEFPSILRLWDSLLSSPDGPMEMVLRVCCSMLICIRDRLLAGDFSSNMKLLQHYPDTDLETVLRIAQSLRTTF